jgi:hypothetical protein
MPSSLVKSDRYGALYQFGFMAADAPTGVAGVTWRSADLKYEPEVFVGAQDGEGQTEALTVSLKTKRKITGTFTGYLEADLDVSTITAHFMFLGRFFVMKKIGTPRKKGEYVEASIEAESYAGVTAVS